MQSLGDSGKPSSAYRAQYARGCAYPLPCHHLPGAASGRGHHRVGAGGPGRPCACQSGPPAHQPCAHSESILARGIPALVPVLPFSTPREWLQPGKRKHTPAGVCRQACRCVPGPCHGPCRAPCSCAGPCPCPCCGLPSCPCRPRRAHGVRGSGSAPKEQWQRRTRSAAARQGLQAHGKPHATGTSLMCLQGRQQHACSAASMQRHQVNPNLSRPWSGGVRGRGGAMTAPVPPFMPAPSPRPSSRAVALLGARCPNATDLGNVLETSEAAMTLLLGCTAGHACGKGPTSRTVKYNPIHTHTLPANRLPCRVQA